MSRLSKKPSWFYSKRKHSKSIMLGSEVVFWRVGGLKALRHTNQLLDSLNFLNRRARIDFDSAPVVQFTARPHILYFQGCSYDCLFC